MTADDMADDPPPVVHPRRRLRSQLSRTLIATSLVSLLIVGIVNFFAARALLADGTREQLVAVAESRVNSIETGVDRVLDRASITATDPAIVSAVGDFTQAFADLDDVAIDPDADAAIDEYYTQTVIDPLATLGIEVGLAEIEPSVPAKFLQAAYTLGDPATATAETPEAAAYEQAIAQHDDYLTSLSEQPEVDDVLLISPDGDIVYTSDKLTDLGVNLRDGPLADTALADAALEQLPKVRAGDSVLADYELYRPSGGDPAAFAIAAVEDGSEVIGSIAIRLSADGLNAITTANQDWEGVGLGAGETYVVGPDRTLLSESRQWIEDPDGYLASVDDELLAEVIEFLGSPVGLQPVDTEPVRQAADGETFAGTASNYLGENTFSYARQIDVGGIRWVVVADQPVGELRSLLWEYAWRLGIVLAIVLPLAAIIGYLIADRLTRSIPPVVAMAEAIADGERDLEVPDLGSNEFGDLASQLHRMAGELGRQEAELADEFERRRQLLLSVLPARLVDDGGEVGDASESIYAGTVVAVVVGFDGDASDTEVATERLRRFGNLVEADAEEFGIERVRTAADRFLFVCGADNDDDGAEQAAGFAHDLVRLSQSLNEEPDDAQLVVSIGMATGAIATGVLERGNLTYTVWGEPVRKAQSIAPLAGAGEILLDVSTTEALGDRWPTDPASDVIALDGEPMRAFVLRAPTTA